MGDSQGIVVNLAQLDPFEKLALFRIPHGNAIVISSGQPPTIREKREAFKAVIFVTPHAKQSFGGGGVPNASKGILHFGGLGTYSREFTAVWRKCHTMSVDPLELQKVLARGCVPEVDMLIVTSRDHLFAFRREGHR